MAVATLIPLLLCLSCLFKWISVSIRSVYLSSLPCNPEPCVSQLILSYSTFSSYLGHLSIYFLLVLSKIKPATEEPLYILILSGVLDVQSSRVQLLQVHAVFSLSLVNFAQKTVEKGLAFLLSFPSGQLLLSVTPHLCSKVVSGICFPQVLYPLCFLPLVTASFSLLMNVLLVLDLISGVASAVSHILHVWVTSQGTATPKLLWLCIKAPLGLVHCG